MSRDDSEGIQVGPVIFSPISRRLLEGGIPNPQGFPSISRNNGVTVAMSVT